MRIKNLLVILLLITGIANVGCASIAANTIDIKNNHTMNPYIGTKCDIQIMRWGGIPLRVCALIDMPMTIIIDTSLLPISIPWWMFTHRDKKWFKEKEKK